MIFKLAILFLAIQFVYCDDLLPLKILDASLVQATGARCMDGSRAGYYYSKGSVPNKWVISLEGGGLCLDQNLCTARSKTDLGSSKNFTNPLPGRTVFSSDPTINPAFWNWTRVHIPYCSSDLWTGTRKSVSNDTWGFYFSGHLIVEGVIQDIMNNYDIENATEILVRGGSAGALGGVTSNIDWFNKKFPNAAISGMMNAGWFTDFTPSWSGPSFPQKMAYGSVLYKSRMNQACMAANPGNETYCLFPRYAWKYLPNRLFSLNSLIDTAMLGNLGFDGNYSNPNAAPYLIGLGHYTNISIYTDFVRDPLVDGLFLTTCFMHGLDESMVIQGRVATDAIYNWYYRVPNAAHVSYDECTIESAVSLTMKNNSLMNDCPRLMALCKKIPPPNVFDLAIQRASQPSAALATNALEDSSKPVVADTVSSAVNLSARFGAAIVCILSFIY